MTSNIKPDAININFPVANTDNTSQGFRDNFEQIKANLQIAAAEITKLQNTTIKLGGVVQSNKVVLTSDPNGSLVVTSFKPTDLANTIEFPGSGAIKVPSGLTSQRPIGAPLPASQGMMRFNTDFKKLEYYNGSRWLSVLDSGSGTISGPLSPNFPNVPSNELLNAQALIIYNLPFIRSQVSQWVIANYPSGYTLTNAQKNRCARDVGVILACVMNDVLTGGNSNSVAAGNSYWNGTQSVLTYNSAQQKTLTSDALNYTLDLVQNIIGNVVVVPDYTTPPNQVTIPAFSGGSIAYTRIASLMRIVQNIIVNGPGQGYANYICTAPGNFSAQTLVWDNLAFLTAEVVAYVNITYPPPGYTYDQAKCARDVQLIIACVMNDVLSGTTVNSTLAGDRYWNNVTSVLVGTNEISVTIDALNYLKQLMNKVVANTVVTGLYQVGVAQVIDLTYTQGVLWAEDISDRIDLINDIILNGPVKESYGIPGPTGPSGGPIGPTGVTGATGPSGGPPGPTGPAGNSSTPGGPTQAVQYNDGGVLNGSTGFRYDGTQAIVDQLQVGQVQITSDTITNILDNGVLNLNSKGQLAELRVTTLGGGYTSVPSVTIESPEMSGIQASGHVSMGAVLATPYNRGLGYQPGDTLLVIGGINLVQTQLLVDTVRIKSAVVDPNNRGVGYKPNDILTVVGGSYPAPATIIVTRCALQNPKIVYTGQGYVTDDIISVFGGNGTSAQVRLVASPITFYGTINTLKYNVVDPTNRSVTLSRYIAPANYFPGIHVWLTPNGGQPTLLTSDVYTVSNNVGNTTTTITIVPALSLFDDDIITFGYDSFVGDGTTSTFILDRQIAEQDYFDLYVTVDKAPAKINVDYTLSETVVSTVTVTQIVFTTAPKTGVIIDTLIGGKVIQAIMTDTDGSYTILPNLLANPAVGGSGSGLILEYDSCVAKPTTGITTVQLQNQGPYYILPSDVNQIEKYNKASGGSGFGAFFDLTSEINALIITDPGNYSLLPPIIENQVTGGTGTGATINLSYGVVSATVDDPGGNYAQTPQVTVDLSPSGNHAKITAIMTGTKVLIGDLVVTGATKGTSPKVTNVLWVTQDGDDTNDGKSEDRAKRTIKAACAVSEAFTTIFVRSGNYVEDNPIYVPERVSIIGDNLRRVNLYYKNPTEDFFWVNNACYIAGVSFRGGREPGYSITYPPLKHPKLPAGVSGAGRISTSPYIQNCTCFNETGGGMKVDGNRASGLKSMVLDAFTQFNQGGPGIHVTNQGYAQLVSVFTICCDIGTLADNGGFCSIGNSNTSFGDIGLLSDGLSPYLYGGTIKAGTAKVTTDTLTVQNISNRPYVGLVATVGPEFSFVSKINILDQGVGYTSAPTMVFDPPVGYAKKPAIAVATIDNPVIGSLDKNIIINDSGEGYTGGAYATIYDISGSGAAVGTLIYYAPLAPSILTGGQGYQIDDLITIVGGTFPSLTIDTPLILKVQGISVGGVVNSISLHNDPNITGPVKSGGEYTVLPIFSGAKTTSDGVGVGFSCSINFGIKSITLSDAGTGYTSPQIIISGGGANTARAIAVFDSVTGTINDTTLISQGSGYITQPIVTILGGGGTSEGSGIAVPTGATAVAQVTNGSITKIRITNPGSNFVLNPTITISGGGGAGAIVGDIFYQAVNVEVHRLVDDTYGNSYYYGGSGYKVNDKLTVVGGIDDGTIGATIVTVASVTSNGITSGIVRSVNILNAGSYTEIPPLNGVTTTTNGGGSGCLLNLSMGILDITLSNGGNSYTSGPRVKFIGGGAQSLSFSSGQSYWAYINNVLVNVLAASGEINATVGAIEYARDLSLQIVNSSPDSVKHAITAFFNSVTSFITNGISLSPYDNAYSLLQLNKAFLQAEVGAYMASAYFSDPVTGLFPGFSMTESQRAYCLRDVGLIVDSISIDAFSGGYVRSIRSGRSYWDGTNSILPTGESLPTQNVIELIRDWAMNLVDNNTSPPTGYGYSGTQYQTSVNPVSDTSKINGEFASENIKASAEIINYIIANGLQTSAPLTAYQLAATAIKNSIESIKTDVIDWINTNYPSLVYDQAKCARDLGYIVNGVTGDLLGAGGSPAIAETVLYPSYYSVNVATPLVVNSGPIVPNPIVESLSFRSGDGYWNAAGNIPNIPPNEYSPTIQAISQIKLLADSIIQNSLVVPLQVDVSQVVDSVDYPDGVLAQGATDAFFDHIGRFINNGTVAPATVKSNYAQTSTLLLANKTFLQDEITAYVQLNYSTLWNGFTVGQKAACRQDVGTIVTGMASDATKGSIIQAIKSGRGYWNGVTQVIGGAEIGPIIDAMGYLKTLCNKLINNITITGVVGPSLPTQYAISTNASDCINAAFDVLIYIISNGPDISPWVDASQLLRLNKEFLQAEITTYVQSSGFLAMFPGFSMTPRQLALCTRDVGFIVDSIAGDLVGDGGEPLAVTSANETNVKFEEFLNYIPLDAEKVNFYRVSVVTTSSHNFEYVGAGTDINTCLPQFGGVPVQENETVTRNGGRIYFTSTDHRGDFRIGNGLVINQSSGTLSGRTFEKSLFGIITPFILSIES